MNTWSVFMAFGVQAAVMAVLGMISHAQTNHEISMEKARERAIESHAKNDWVTKISKSEFEHMMADKQCYCNVMTRIANDLNIPYSFYVENGVITFCVDFGGRK